MPIGIGTGSAFGEVGLNGIAGRQMLAGFGGQGEAGCLHNGLKARREAHGACRGGMPMRVLDMLYPVQPVLNGGWIPI